MGANIYLFGARRFRESIMMQICRCKSISRYLRYRRLFILLSILESVILLCYMALQTVHHFNLSIYFFQLSPSFQSFFIKQLRTSLIGNCAQHNVRSSVASKINLKYLLSAITKFAITVCTFDSQASSQHSSKKSNV